VTEEAGPVRRQRLRVVAVAQFVAMAGIGRQGP